MSGPPPDPPLGIKVTEAEIRAVVATPMRAASGAWASIGAVLGVVVDVGVLDVEGVTCSVTVIVNSSGSLTPPSGSTTVATTVYVPAAV